MQPSQGVFVLPLWPSDREVPLPKQKARAIAPAAAPSAWVPLDKSVHRTGANFDTKSGQWICSGMTCAFLVAAKQRRRLRACARVPSCTIIRAATEVSADAVPASKTTESRARVVKRVSDVAVVVTEMLGEQDDERLPQVGDVIQFSSGSIGYVIAVSDMCFAAALQNFSDPVAEGDRYFIMPKSLQPTVRLPQVGGAMIDVLGNGLDEASAAKLSSADSAEENETGWFNEMVDLIQRQRINSPLHAGVMGLDSFVPIGRGQSMLLRLPPSVTSEQLPQFTSHIARAQTGSNVRVVAAVATAEEGRKLQELVANSGAEDQLVIVAGRSETPCLGESLLAMNAACAIAEAHRDTGGDALLLLNVEQLSQVWDLLCDVTDELALEERAAKTQAEKDELAKLPEEMGVQLWKYVARKNAMTARRRTFLGCFLQRAGRMADSRGGGSMTLLAFARLKDESALSRAVLEQKLQTVQAMQLDEALKAKAIAKVEEQLAELEDASSATGVPDDFIEEAKAVTDGHVVFLDHTSGEGGAPRWCVDLQESVARGITADTVQNRPLHILKSLNLKMYLMAREEGNQVMECREDGSKLDNGPLLALMEQPVGDVLSVEDEAAFLLVALDDAKWAMDSFSLAEEILELLGKSRVRSVDEETSNKLVVGVRRWAETCWRKADKAVSLEDLSASDIEDLSAALGLKPLERKRVLVAFADPSSASTDESSMIPSLAEDLTGRYQSMRKRLDRVRSDPEMAKLLAGIGKSSIPDDELTDQLNTLMTRIAQGAGNTTTREFVQSE